MEEAKNKLPSRRCPPLIVALGSGVSHGGSLGVRCGPEEDYEKIHLQPWDCVCNKAGMPIALRVAKPDRVCRLCLVMGRSLHLQGEAGERVLALAGVREG